MTSNQQAESTETPDRVQTPDGERPLNVTTLALSVTILGFATVVLLILIA